MNDDTACIIYSILFVSFILFLMVLHTQNRNLIADQESFRAEQARERRIKIKRIYKHKKQAYEEALSKLSQFPNESSMKVDALEKGREFIQISRVAKKELDLEAYDEMKIQNDINAYS